LPLEITIVIPAFNASQYIDETISSVLAQTFTDWELIVVDDGSTDTTAEIVKKYLTDRRITLIPQQNRGVSAARNTGIKAASGKFITFLDADDSFMEDCLQHKYDALRSDDSVDFVYSDMWMCDKDMKKLYVIKGGKTEGLLERVLLWGKEKMPGLASNIAIRTSSIKDDVLYDECLSTSADRDLEIRLARYYKGFYIPLPLFKYRDTPGSMGKDMTLLEYDELHILKKISKENIVPNGTLRRKAIATTYFIIAGSCHKIRRKPVRAIRFWIKGLVVYPPYIMKLVRSDSLK